MSESRTALSSGTAENELKSKQTWWWLISLLTPSTWSVSPAAAVPTRRSSACPTTALRRCRARLEHTDAVKVKAQSEFGKAKSLRLFVPYSFFFTREDELCGQFSHGGQELLLGEHIQPVLTQTPERHLGGNTGQSREKTQKS